MVNEGFKPHTYWEPQTWGPTAGRWSPSAGLTISGTYQMTVRNGHSASENIDLCLITPQEQSRGSRLKTSQNSGQFPAITLATPYPAPGTCTSSSYSSQLSTRVKVAVGQRRVCMLRENGDILDWLCLWTRWRQPYQCTCKGNRLKAAWGSHWLPSMCPSLLQTPARAPFAPIMFSIGANVLLLSRGCTPVETEPGQTQCCFWTGQRKAVLAPT